MDENGAVEFIGITFAQPVIRPGSRSERAESPETLRDSCEVMQSFRSNYVNLFASTSASRTRPLLASGCGCQDRRLSRGRGNHRRLL
jgi:hypothetical protein